MEKFKVMDTDITVINVNDDDYICLTDMIRANVNSKAKFPHDSI